MTGNGEMKDRTSAKAGSTVQTNFNDASLVHRAFSSRLTSGQNSCRLIPHSILANPGTMRPNPARSILSSKLHARKEILTRRSRHQQSTQHLNLLPLNHNADALLPGLHRVFH